MPANANPLRIINMPTAAAVAQFAAVDSTGAVAAAGSAAIGFTTASAKAGGAAPVCVMGSAVAWAGSAITIGQSLEVGSAGTVVPNVGGIKIGTALNTAASGDQVEVLISSGGSVSGGGFLTRARLARPSQLVQPAMLNAGAPTNRTFTNAFSAWGPFHAVEFLFQNPTGSAITVDNLTFAPTANAVMKSDDMVQPSGGTAAFVAALGSFNMANTGSVANPGLNWTPQYACRSLPRADGSPYPVILVRDYRNAVAPYYHGGNSFNALLDGTFAAGAGGHIFGTGGKANDMCATPASWTTGGVDTSGPLQTVTAVRFEYDQRMRTIMALGDSVDAGENSVNRPQLSAGFLATLQLSQAGFKVAHMAAGIGGQTAAQIDARGRAIIASVKPDIVVLSSFTSNTAYATQADWDAQWQLFAGLAEYALSQGCTPVLMTPRPKSGLSGAQATMRATQRARVLASGLPYCDVEAAVTATDGTGNWASGLSGDGTHGTQAAYNAIALLLAAAIQPYVG